MDKHRGYEIKIDGEKCKIVDKRIENFTSWEDLPCGHCGLTNTKEGHDGCLGTMIGTMNACCGHGEVKSAYIQFLDGKTVHGKDAEIILNVLKN